MSKNKEISIGEAAKLCGVSVKQLRHWHNKGYIPEPHMVSCGERSYRFFSEKDVALIRSIKSLLDEGYRLPVAVKKATEFCGGK